MPSAGFRASLGSLFSNLRAAWFPSYLLASPPVEMIVCQQGLDMLQCE
jgi:hypothetical protein